jgi:hypothetical protein
MTIIFTVRPGPTATANEPLVLDPLINTEKCLSPIALLSDGTGSQVSDLPDDCSCHTPSVSEQVNERLVFM